MTKKMIIKGIWSIILNRVQTTALKWNLSKVYRSDNAYPDFPSAIQTRWLKEHARNNFPILHLLFSPFWRVLPSQKLKTGRLFLRFCSVRTHQYRLNPSAIYTRYLMSIPERVVFGHIFIYSK